MARNEIMEELWAARESYASRFGHDMEAIFRDAQKRQEERSDREILPPSPRQIPKVKTSPNQ